MGNSPKVLLEHEYLQQQGWTEEQSAAKYPAVANTRTVSRHVATTISECRFFNRRYTSVHQQADKANFY